MTMMLCALLITFISLCNGQLRVLGPESLKEEFDDQGDEGYIPAATATFGSPAYGESFIGQLIALNTTGCDDDSYVSSMSKYETSLPGRKIFLINRGGCSFVRKVSVAEQNHADAVVIADSSNSSWDRAHIRRVILADDGSGLRVKIPSLLITKVDADILSDAAAKSAVTISLDWNLPRGSLVSVDFWYLSGSNEALRFLGAMKPAVEILQGIVDFQPHIYVFRLVDSSGRHVDQSSYDLARQMCFEHDPTLCALPPDAGSQASAAEVLEENIRELCLLDTTSVAIPIKEEPTQSVSFSQTWWDYMGNLSTFCPLKPTAKLGENHFGTNCAMNLLVKLNQNILGMSDCQEGRARELLQTARENNAWGNLALRINDARFSGALEPRLVLKAICSAFEKEPVECQDAMLALEENGGDEGRHSRPSGDENERNHGSDFLRSLTMMSMMVVASVAIIYAYQAWREETAKKAIRQQVVMEVKTQLQDYYRVEDPPLTQWASSSHDVPRTREMEFSSLKIR